MYSESIILKTLVDFEKHNGWMPVVHSLDEVEEFKEYIDSLIDVTRNERNSFYDFKPGIRVSENKKQQIRRWITNEQFMCFADFDYFASRYAYICNEAGDIFKFKKRKSQEVFSKIIDPFDEMQVAIELFCLKARQLGISTLVALYFLHRLLFIPHTQGVMASVKARNSELLARILDTCWQRLPFWLTPMQISPKADSPKWANGSIMSIQSGSQAMGIAQGWTPTLIHISELADIPNPKKVLEEGLFPAAHSTRKLFFVLEGTGSDSNLWQKEKWTYYKQNWGKGGRFLPVFIPWPCATDLYPEADWLRKNPVPGGWIMLPETKRMKAKAELYIRSTDYLAKIMGKNWTMPREQAWFWETKYREAAETHTLKTMLSQFPCSDEEAFQSKNDRILSDEVIDRIEVVAFGAEKTDRPYTAYAVTGKSVLIGQDDEPYEPDPEQIDYSKERIKVSWKSRQGETYYWELVPLLPFDDSDDPQCFNKLLVFDPPREGCDYAIGVDTAWGLGNPDEDRSVASVMLNRKGNQRDEQVAEFVSNIVNQAQFVSILACIASWYGQWVGGTAGTKHALGAKFIIEQVTRAGDTCQHQLKLLGFIHHHIFVRYDEKRTDQHKGTKQGWYMREWSRDILLPIFVDTLNGGWVKLNSPMCIRQLRNWVRKTDEKTGKVRIDHESGHHDDNIMGAAMAYFTAHHFDVHVARQQSKYANPNEDMPKISYEFCANQVQI